MSIELLKALTRKEELKFLKKDLDKKFRKVFFQRVCLWAKFYLSVLIHIIIITMMISIAFALLYLFGRAWIHCIDKLFAPLDAALNIYYKSLL